MVPPRRIELPTPPLPRMISKKKTLQNNNSKLLKLLNYALQCIQKCIQQDLILNFPTLFLKSFD